MVISGKVSICVLTYNRPKLLMQLVESILNQSYKDFEIIITDNSDNFEAERAIKTIEDPRIRYFRNEKNLGMGGNAVRNFSLATGEYFTFTPDDDLWIDEDKLYKQVNFLKENPSVNIVYSNAKSISYDGEELEDFTSVYTGNGSELLNADLLLPGKRHDYFLNILTPLIRSKKFIEIMSNSFRFNTEELFCYYMGATESKIGFIYDKLVALRETEHHRTLVEDGKVVDYKGNKVLRIKQLIAIYLTLTNFYPEVHDKMSRVEVQQSLGNYILSLLAGEKMIVMVIRYNKVLRVFFKNFSFTTFLVSYVKSIFNKNTIKSFG